MPKKNAPRATPLITSYDIGGINVKGSLANDLPNTTIAP